jgi:hypothetical protein
LGVFRGFSQICTPEGQENFGFPALFPVFCCLVGVFWTISDFCTPVLSKTGVQNRKNLRKTPMGLLQSPAFLEDSPSEGYRILKTAQKRPNRSTQA